MTEHIHQLKKEIIRWTINEEDEMNRLSISYFLANNLLDTMTMHDGFDGKYKSPPISI